MVNLRVRRLVKDRRVFVDTGNLYMYRHYPREGGSPTVFGSNDQLRDGLVRLIYHCSVGVDYT